MVGRSNVIHRRCINPAGERACNFRTAFTEGEMPKALEVCSLIYCQIEGKCR